MVFTWMAFAWANVNVLVQAEVEEKFSSQVKNVERSFDDHELELIEKGFIFFPPREIIKPSEKKNLPETNKIEQSQLKKAIKETSDEITFNKKDEDIKKRNNENNQSNLNELEKNNKDNKKSNIEKNYNLPTLGDSKKQESQDAQIEEIKNNIIEKQKTIKLDEKSKININSNNTTYTYGDYTSNAILRIGIQNNFESKSDANKLPSLTSNGGIQITKNSAIGFYYRGSKKKNDITLNAINNIPETNFYTKISTGIMDGKDVYKFYSGLSEVHLQQFNSLASLNYRNPNKFSSFRGIGLNIWKIVARQRTNFEPVYITKETDNSFDTYMDPKTLSLGNVTGYSGSIKLKINNALLIEQAAGKEKLFYPFSNGNKEININNYYKTAVKYYINENSSLEAAYATGAIESKTRIEYLNSGFGFSIENSKGINGHRDNWFVGLAYTIVDALNPYVASRSINRYDEEDYLEHRSLLNEVSSRPIEFPSSFLAKVDPTSIRLIKSVSKGIVTWNSVGLLGTYFDSITPNRNNISIQLSAINSSNAIVKYQTSLISGSLPNGLTLNEDGLISGTAAPVVSDTTYTFQVKAISEGASDQISQSLSIIIKAPSSIAWISSGTLITLNDSIAPSRSNVSIQLDARTTSINPLVYETNLVSGSLPPGLSLNSSGLITGSTTQVAQETTYTFIVRAHTADLTAVQSSSLSITVRPPPIVTWVSSGNLASLQNCQSSVLDIPLNATSSTSESLTFSLNSGSLPSGLVLNSNGRITGTMQEVEVNSTFNFTVRATSTSGVSAVSSALSISKTTNGFIFNPVNSHYYQHFSASSITWDQAKVLAEGKSCGILQGYLATITTSNELNFIDTKVYPTLPKPINIFVGGNSVGAVGTWRWVTGPEGLMDSGQGQLFYSNNTIQNGLIATWRGDPNLANSRHLFIYAFSVPQFFPWETGNINPTVGASGTGGYLVEYGN
jgi:hypothetical protein